jgi:hypothetical protein
MPPEIPDHPLARALYFKRLEEGNVMIPPPPARPVTVTCPLCAWTIGRDARGAEAAQIAANLAVALYEHIDTTHHCPSKR